MAIEIIPYSDDLVRAVREFNSRLSAGGESARLPERPVTRWLPKVEGRRLYREIFLALENGSIVRGGFILKHQDFAFEGEVKSIACLQLPLSEGVGNRSYNHVGIHILTSALKKQPLLFALGMGGHRQPLPVMLKTMGWGLRSIPFYFKVNSPTHFLRNLRVLRRRKSTRIVAGTLAMTGLGWAANQMLQATLESKARQASGIAVDIAKEFSGWSDELWDDSRSKYPLIAVRNAQTLDITFPADMKGVLRLKVSRRGSPIGWVVILDTRMSEDKHFGNMRVATIVDCLARPENAVDVIRAATKYVERRGVDLIVSNQSHRMWCSALRCAGFLRAPSNYVFAESKMLASLILSSNADLSTTHLNRGDGDGPIHL